MNFGTPVPLLIGIILILEALALFFLDKYRPGYERDSDKVYAVLLLISGIFLLGHLQLELIPAFQQLLMAGMVTALLVESVRNREPRIIDAVRSLENRQPPRPRYDERPPSRRVYRAELDDRGLPLRDRPRTARMGPSQDEYWPGDYRDQSAQRPRQPYEEFREPVGRLQPSPDSRPAPRPDTRPDSRPESRSDFRPDRPQDDRYADNRYSDGNGRYGERPPTRPPESRPPEGSRPPQSRSPQSRPPQSRPPQDDRPPQRQSDQFPPQGGSNRPNNGVSNPADGSASNSDRSLNVRPYSEAPKLDLDDRSRQRPDIRPEGRPADI
ncbi:MAG: Ycf66 family protein [Phormidesmis sp.]